MKKDKQFLSDKIREIAHITRLAGIVLKEDYNSDSEFWLDAVIKGFLYVNIEHIEMNGDFTTYGLNKLSSDIISEYAEKMATLHDHMVIKAQQIDQLLKAIKLSIASVDALKVTDSDKLEKKFRRVCERNAAMFEKFLVTVSDSTINLKLREAFYEQLKVIVTKANKLMKEKSVEPEMKTKLYSNNNAGVVFEGSNDDTDNDQTVTINSSFGKRKRDSEGSTVTDVPAESVSRSDLRYSIVAENDISNRDYYALENQLEKKLGSKLAVHVEILNANYFHCTTCRLLFETVSDIGHHMDTVHKGKNEKLLKQQSEGKAAENDKAVAANGRLPTNATINDVVSQTGCDSRQYEIEPPPSYLVKLVDQVDGHGKFLKVMETFKIFCSRCSCYVVLDSITDHISFELHNFGWSTKANDGKEFLNIPELNSVWISEDDKHLILNDKYLSPDCRFCELCSSYISYEKTLKHLKSAKHKREVKNVEVKSQLLNRELVIKITNEWLNSVVKNRTKGDLFCILCKVPLGTDSRNAILHIVGKKHRKIRKNTDTKMSR